MQHQLCMSTCKRNPGPASRKALGHALEANVSTSAFLCCVLEVMNAKLLSFFPKPALNIKKKNTIGCNR